MWGIIALYVGGKRVKATKALKIFLRVLFAFCLLFTSLTFCENWRRAFMFSQSARPLKFILSFFLPGISSALSIAADRNLKFAGRLSAASMIAFVIHYYIDTNTLHLIDVYGGFMVPYHFAYGMISFFSVFAAAVLCALFIKEIKADFERFYKVFFRGYTVLFIFLFIQLFFVLRDWEQQYSVNLVPFHGEISELAAAVSYGANSFMLKMIRFAGNIMFFATAPLLLGAFIKKKKKTLLILCPIALSVAAELFQFLANAGDCDIDDVILNTAGVLIGFAAFSFINKKLFAEEKSCLV